MSKYVIIDIYKNVIKLNVIWNMLYIVYANQDIFKKLTVELTTDSHAQSTEYTKTPIYYYLVIREKGETILEGTFEKYS